MSDIVNTNQAAIWNGNQGEEWARNFERYDRSMASYQALINQFAAIVDGERILDIGCGNGATTRDAARQTPHGSVLGVDISSPMLERARELSVIEGLNNVAFVHGDAQVYPFEEGQFNLVLSRFGSMFFADKVAAFSNIRRSLRSGGRLLFVTWQPISENDNFRLVNRAGALGVDLPPPPSGAPSPFGISDPELGRQWFIEAGFVDVSFRSEERPFLYAEDANRAVAAAIARGFASDLEGPDRDRALHLLDELMNSHMTPSGVLFDTATWFISARQS